jgi:hypothetical protein
MEYHEHQTGLGTGDQERCVIETEPGSVMPSRDVDDRKSWLNRWRAEIIDQTYSRQPATDAVSVSPVRALLISSGKALA